MTLLERISKDMDTCCGHHRKKDKRQKQNFLSSSAKYLDHLTAFFTSFYRVLGSACASFSVCFFNRFIMCSVWGRGMRVYPKFSRSLFFFSLLCR